MRSAATIPAFVAILVITDSVVMANPALMQKNKLGIPIREQPPSNTSAQRHCRKRS